MLACPLGDTVAVDRLARVLLVGLLGLLLGSLKLNDVYVGVLVLVTGPSATAEVTAATGACGEMGALDVDLRRLQMVALLVATNGKVLGVLTALIQRVSRPMLRKDIAVAALVLAGELVAAGAAIAFATVAIPLALISVLVLPESNNNLSNFFEATVLIMPLTPMVMVERLGSHRFFL